MAKLKIPLTFENVAVGSKAVANIPLGMRILGIELQCGGTVAADSSDQTYDKIIKDIFVKVNDNVQRTMTAVELNDINSINGSLCAKRVMDGTFAAGGFDRTFLPIYFAKPWLRFLRDAEKISGLCTDWMNSMKLEVQLFASAEVTNGLANPVLSATIIADDYQSKDAEDRLMEKWIRFDQTASGTSQTFTQLIDRKDLIQQISLYNPTGAAITRAKLKAAGREWFNMTKHEMTAFGQHFGEMIYAAEATTSTITRYDIAFDEWGAIADGLPAGALNSIELALEYSAAASGNIRGIIQRYGPVE